MGRSARGRRAALLVHQVRAGVPGVRKMKLREYLAARDAFVESVVYQMLRALPVASEVLECLLSRAFAEADRRWMAAQAPNITAAGTELSLPDPVPDARQV